MSEPKSHQEENSDEQVPSALVELRRELRALQELQPPSELTVVGELDALAARLVALRREPPVDREAIWARIERELEAETHS